jgi:hypothetical protein
MSSVWCKKSALGAIVGFVSIAMVSGVSQAGSLVLGTSGWSASWDDALDGRLGLAVDGESADSVFIQKFLTLRPEDINLVEMATDPVVITFQRTSVNAVPFIVFNDENVVNQTGFPWVGFRFIIEPTSGEVAFDAGRTDVSPPGAGFSIDPFTTHQYSQNNTVLELGGGIVPENLPQNIWSPGMAQGELAINTVAQPNELNSFTFSEQALIIPLPAAAWSGMIGLALLALGKPLRRLFA